MTVNSLVSATDCNSSIRNPVKVPLPQACDFSEPEYSMLAVRLPRVDKRKPLVKDAKDSMMGSVSDQQQQSWLSSTSSSPPSFDHTHTKVNIPPPQQTKDVKTSFKPSSSGGRQGRRGNPGITAARRRYLLEKAAEQEEAEAASRVLKAGYQTSEMSPTSSAPLLNRSCASNSSSSMSSTSRTLAEQRAAPQPVVLLPSQSLYARDPTSMSTTTNGFHNLSSSYGRPTSAFQHPLPQLPNDLSYPSSKIVGGSHRAQNDWAMGQYLFIKVCGLPDSTTTRDLWTAFKREGHIAYIQLYENTKGYRDGKASVKFRYASIFGP